MHWTEFRHHLRRFSSAEQAEIEKAFEIGARAHGEQKRMSGEPYFHHPIAVARILLDMDADRDTVIAALLHDTVEDTPMTVKEIEQGFGKNVASLIDGVTRLKLTDVDQRPSLNEQTESLRKMFTLMQQDVRIMVIKLADRLHNMQTIGHMPMEKQMMVARETMDIYVKIADRLCMRDLQTTLEGLCLAVLEPELHARLQELRIAKDAKGQPVLRMLTEMLYQHHPEFIQEMPILYEQKSWYRLREQLKSHSARVTGIATMAVTFVCKNVDECYQVMGALHQLWQREILSFQDFINGPMINGYRGLHTTIILEDGTRVRCKIRTEEMQLYAHRGITIFCFDNKAKGPLDYLPWTKHIATIATDTIDKSAEFWEGLQSDILQETITIYGPDGQSVQVPTGSTALDGAFFLLHERANMTKGIQIKGGLVPFSQPLENGVTLSIELDMHPTVIRDWLHAVQTGFAAALIRSYLGQTSKEELRAIGRSLLQEALIERGKWYLEEFDEKLLKSIFYEMGFHSETDAYEAIASGRLDSNTVITALTGGGKHPRAVAPVQTTTDFTVASAGEAFALLERITRLYGGASSHTIQSSMRSTDSGTRISFSTPLSHDQSQTLKKDLITSGAKHVSIRSPLRGAIGLMLLVVFFWALNPVIAKWLLLQGVTTLDLLTLRSLSFCVLATIMLVVWSAMHGGAFAPIPKGTRIAILPAVTSLLLTLCTYLSLSWLPASVHLTILRLNVFLLPLIFVARRNLHKPTMLIGSAVSACALIAFEFHHMDSFAGIIFATTSLLAYMLYSQVSERAMQKGKIGIRYPFFLFQVGCIFGIVGLVLLPLLSFSLLTPPLLLNIFLYTFFCVFVPHTCFHAVLQRARFSRITDLSLMEVPLAIVFEIILLGIVLPFSEYAVIAFVLVCASLFAYRSFVQRKTNQQLNGESA